MRILHVISSPAAGGAEVYVRDLSKEMVRQGHTVFVGFLDAARDVGRSIEYEEEFLSQLRDAGVGYFFIGGEARRNPLRGILAIRRFVRENHIDVYHSHLSYGMLFGVGLSVLRIYTQHSVKMRLPMPVFRLLSRFVEIQVAVSDRCAAMLSGASRRSVTTIHNGVDPGRFTAAIRQLPLPPDLVRLVAVGRIQKPKNYPLLLEALSLLPDVLRQRIRLAIVGEGGRELTDALRALVESLGLQEQVRFLGNRSDIPGLLSSAHLFVMSSAWEGMPIALIEAAISGLPAVVTDVGGCAEVVADGESGIVVGDLDARSYAAALMGVLEDAQGFERMSVGALREAGRFHIAQAAARHIEAYQSGGRE